MSNNHADDLSPEETVDELTFRSYMWQRIISPDVAAERWIALFPNGPELEARYQREIHNMPKGRKSFPPAHFGQRSKYAAEPESDIERDRR